MCSHINMSSSNHSLLMSPNRARLRSNTLVALPCVPTTMAIPKGPKYPHGKLPPSVVDRVSQPTVRIRVHFEPWTTTAPPKEPSQAFAPKDPWTGPQPMSASSLADTAITRRTAVDPAARGHTGIPLPRMALPRSTSLGSGEETAAKGLPVPMTLLYQPPPLGYRTQYWG